MRTIVSVDICSECAAPLVRTSELYWACPNGHGKLVPAAMPDSDKVVSERRAFERRVADAVRASRDSNLKYLKSVIAQTLNGIMLRPSPTKRGKR